MDADKCLTSQRKVKEMGKKNRIKQNQIAKNKRNLERSIKSDVAQKMLKENGIKKAKTKMMPIEIDGETIYREQRTAYLKRTKDGLAIGFAQEFNDYEKALVMGFVDQFSDIRKIPKCSLTMPHVVSRKEAENCFVMSHMGGDF